MFTVDELTVIPSNRKDTELLEGVVMTNGADGGIKNVGDGGEGDGGGGGSGGDSGSACDSTTSTAETKLAKKFIDLSDEPPPVFWIDAYSQGKILPRELTLSSGPDANILFYDYEPKVEPLVGFDMSFMHV
jgi:hypothetical protein